VGDFDKDQDIDVASSSIYNDNIAWYENDGNEFFTRNLVDTLVDYTYAISAGDIDSDGDMDIVAASYEHNTVSWYELDEGNNFIKHKITDSIYYSFALTVIDIDKDGDTDVLATANWENKIFLCENNGMEEFTLHTLTSSSMGPHSIYAMDINRDGRIDIVTCGADRAPVYMDELAWFENKSSSISNYDASTTVTDVTILSQNYPNPFHISTNISYKLQGSCDVKLSIYDITGRMIKTIVEETQSAGEYTISFSGRELETGIYFYEIQASSHRSSRRMLLLK
jgi:WD40 repeat protein